MNLKKQKTSKNKYGNVIERLSDKLFRKYSAITKKIRVGNTKAIILIASGFIKLSVKLFPNNIFQLHQSFLGM